MQVIKQNFLSMRKQIFVDKIAGGGSVAEASREAGVTSQTGRKWLNKDEDLRAAVLDAYRENNLDPSEIIRFHKKIRDCAFRKNDLGEARRANMDLGKGMGIFNDKIQQRAGGDDEAKLKLLEKLVDRLEAREVKAEVVG